MKRILLTLLCIFTLNSFAKCQYYIQYFDGADTVFENSVNVYIDSSSADVWQIGKPRKILFDSPATQPNVIITDTIDNYSTDSYGYFTIKILPQAWTWGIWALQWKQKLDMDLDYDGGVIQMTTDHGDTWTNVFNNPYVYNFYGYNPLNSDTLVFYDEASFSGTDTNWRDIWLCFDMSWMSSFPDTLILRFNFISDGVDNNREGWMIDNFISHITFVHTVNEKEVSDYMKVFPNPTTDFINIETKKMNEFHIIEELDLMDVQGKILDRWRNVPTKFWIDVRNYSEGNYFLRVKSNLKTETIPFTICK